MPGASDSPDALIVRTREALLSALDALAAQREAVIVIGAQAVYLRTPRLDVALAETTKDSDLLIDPTELSDDPRVEEAMLAAGMIRNPTDAQPGAWQTPGGIPVDLMVPEAFAGKGRRSVSLPPHAKDSMRRAAGLEAAVVDHDVLNVAALDPDDTRTFEVRVAGSAALLVAKAYKIVERFESPDRLRDKDAHDMYRLLRAEKTQELARRFSVLLDDARSAAVTDQALAWLGEHVATSPSARIAQMAGAAEELVGDPEQVAASASFLAADLLSSLGR